MFFESYFYMVLHWCISLPLHPNPQNIFNKEEVVIVCEPGGFTQTHVVEYVSVLCLVNGCMTVISRMVKKTNTWEKIFFTLVVQVYKGILKKYRPIIYTNI